MDRTSASRRVARVVVEARSDVEKKATPSDAPEKKGARIRSKAQATSVRMKVVWEVCNGTGKILETFAYPDKAAAEAKTRALTRSSGRAHMLRATKVPME